MKTLEQLKSIPILKDLSVSDLNSLSEIVVSKTYLAGEEIFYEKEQAKGFFALISGKVKIYKLAFTGKEHILHIFGPGEIFAEVAVFFDQEYPANAMALEDSFVLFFPRLEFKRLLGQSPDLGLHLMGLFSLRLREMVAKVEALSLKEVPARLASHLLFFREIKKKNEFTLEISKHQLASLLGTIPETLSRVMKKFKEKEIFYLKGNKVILKDIEALQQIALGKKRI